MCERIAVLIDTGEWYNVSMLTYFHTTFKIETYRMMIYTSPRLYSSTIWSGHHHFSPYISLRLWMPVFFMLCFTCLSCGNIRKRYDWANAGNLVVGATLVSINSSPERCCLDPSGRFRGGWGRVYIGNCLWFGVNYVFTNWLFLRQGSFDTGWFMIELTLF